jgi:hypothetical protein
MSADATDQTPVDDVRRVREELDRECGGNISKLATLANKMAEAYRQTLSLKVVRPPASEGRERTSIDQNECSGK